MKKLLLFTVFGPFFGAMVMYIYTLYELHSSLDIIDRNILWGGGLYLVFGYIYGVLSAFLTGLVSIALDFQRWLHVIWLIIFAIAITSVTHNIFFRIKTEELFVYAILPSFVATLVISLFVRNRRVVYTFFTKIA